MSWNHRVLAHKDGDEVWFSIHEVYYDENGIPKSYTANGVNVGGNSIKDLSWTLDKMKECLDKPILSLENFPETFNTKDEATEMLRASLLEQVNQLSDDEIISLYDNLSKFLNTKEQ